MKQCLLATIFITLFSSGLLASTKDSCTLFAIPKSQHKQSVVDKKTSLTGWATCEKSDHSIDLYQIDGSLQNKNLRSWINSRFKQIYKSENIDLKIKIVTSTTQITFFQITVKLGSNEDRYFLASTKNKSNVKIAIHPIRGSFRAKTKHSKLLLQNLLSKKQKDILLKTVILGGNS